MLTIHVCWLGACLNERSVGRQRAFSVVYHWTFAAAAAPGAAPTVNMIQAEDLRLLTLMISVTGVDFRTQRWLPLWQVKESTHQRKHTHAHTRTRQINTSGSHTAWVRRPSMTHFDYSVLKQQVTGLPRMSSVRLASVQRRQFRIHGEQQAGKMPDLQVSCPIIDIKWAQDVMSSSRKSSIPLSGWIKLSVAAEGQISVAGHTLPPGGNVWKKISHGTLACLIQAAILIPIKAIKAQLIKTIRNRCACMCAQWFPWLQIYIFFGLNIFTVCIS